MVPEATSQLSRRAAHGSSQVMRPRKQRPSGSLLSGSKEQFPALPPPPAPPELPICSLKQIFLYSTAQRSGPLETSVLLENLWGWEVS